MAKRRSRGKGSIFRRKDGLWAAEVTLPSGKKMTKYSKVQKVVRDWLQEQQNGLRQGIWSDAESVTVQTFLERYKADVVLHTLRPKTQETYTIIIDTHLVPEIGRIKLNALRPDHLQKLYSDKLKAGKSRRTVQHIHAVVHRALTHAVKWGLVPRNVADAVEAPRPQQKPPEMLTEAQALSFLDYVKDDPLYPLWLTLFSTGMRKGEVLGLRWSDVDMAAGIIHVSQVAQAVHKRGTMISEPKTDQSRRSIGLPPMTVAALKVHKERTARYQDFEYFKDQDLVFCTKRGTPFGSRNLLTYFHRALVKAGLPTVTLHSLRHLHATMLLKAGLHPKIVQSRLGHSQIGMTMDLYSHVMPGMDEKATDEISRVLGAATTA